MKLNYCIECPNCGYQYLPCEIFLPDNILSKSYHIERDDKGKIIDALEFNPEFKEKYICDKCNQVFECELKLSFNYKMDKNLNFGEDYIVPIKKKEKIELAEE